MASPTLTRAQLAVALHVDDDDTDQAAQLDRVLDTASALVEAVTEDAPVEVANEAVVRVAGWLFDTDPAMPKNGDPLKASGAAQLLARWRPITLAGPDDEDDE